ncbi:AraC family transcriptional regulator [Bifidobacterium ramosum]|uniref:AraC family transcriptional regulator n=1 Tax=Bifidobacterium ramosum TaxID=1798158 RepID=A0A6L4X0A3_9BIFI|nr:helix-turn-helix domain-containing protein [Bifidobacterium ramosum]KAB8287535.1 AraC family transcriptional regulator [Bifidobacterium ramosum]NEG72256.1 helix-turn-helix domain-containing protein [Bifidobacterium ramosum]
MDQIASEAKLRYLDFISREDRIRHHRYVEEMKQYDLMRSGDGAAIAESARLWDSGLYGHLSDDPVRNAKYRFVTSITLATRFAIEGGMDEEDAYNASDLYIQDMDRCKDANDVRRLHTDMMTFFTWAMADMQRSEIHSKAVSECMDYIHYHLHERITVAQLARHVNLNPTYLSELFARETGTPISRYITGKRMEAAENMLKYSDYPLGEIAQILAYRSQSHFTKVFSKHAGMTPGDYRRKYATTGIWPQ